MLGKKSTNVDQYISSFPEPTQKILEQVRTCIKKAAPKAEEIIGYGIPTFKLNGNLVHFAGYKHHIGFYPGADGIAAFEKELAGYKTSKGAVQFPIDKRMPLSLITQIVKYRVMKNLEIPAKKK